jgi:F420-non-reducing hydrogenase iron-sulfur subunit
MTAVPASEAATKGAAAVAPSAWNPSIVVFACNWCSYAGADTAGVSRMQHQPHFRMIRVMCSGRIQPGFVFRAFEKGADGVLVSGCHFGDCHYVFGNERAVEQFDKTMSVVQLLGLEKERLRLEWISAAEGARFAQIINEFTDQVRKLGPSPFSLRNRSGSTIPGGNGDPERADDPSGLTTEGVGADA